MRASERRLTTVDVSSRHISFEMLGGLSGNLLLVIAEIFGLAGTPFEHPDRDKRSFDRLSGSARMSPERADNRHMISSCK
jgi:hypothetical protein